MQIKDPVFKDRLVVTNDVQPTKKWAGMIGTLVVVGSLGAIVYYFYPNITQYVNTYVNTFNQPKTAESPSTVTPEITAPVTTAHEQDLAVADTHETAHSARPIEPKAAPSKPVATSLVPATSPDTLISVPTQPVVPSIEPATVASVPVTSVDTLVQPVAPPQTEPSAELTETAERLLAKARKQIELERFTSPKGDNAYETYQALLKTAPKPAQDVLETLVAWYFEQGNKYLSEDPLTRRTRGKAYKMYHKLSEIAPQHQSTQTLLSEIFDILTQRAEQQFQKQELFTPDDDNVYTTYQEMLIVAPSSQKTQRLLQTLLELLLAKASRQMEKRKYTRPTDDNAADTYQKVLQISPDNAEAQNGINKIIMKYYKLAETKKKLGRLKASLTWIERGLQVAPDHSDLNQLKQEVLDELYQ